MQHSVEVIPVQSRADLDRFLEFPYRLYRGDPNWVAPLRIDQKALFDRAKHPFYKHADAQFFLAIDRGEVVGRIAAIEDRAHNQASGEKLGTFGFWEAFDSQTVADALFSAARRELAARGLTTMRGPMNPSINYECGLLIDGFDSAPAVMTTYNPPYYQGLFERAGLKKARDLFAYRMLSENGPQVISRLDRAIRVSPPSDIQLRDGRLARFDQELEIIWNIYSAAWKQNWGASPMSRDEMMRLGRELKPVVIPELAQFAEIGGEPIGFALAIPDANQAIRHAGGSLFPLGLLKILYFKSKIRSVRVVALGVLQQYQKTSAAAQLYSAIIRNSIKLGFKEADCSWILEDNVPMNRSLEFMGATRYKTYRLYEASL
jgi:GNAT superfamily N-acetyltransferase